MLSESSSSYLGTVQDNNRYKLTPSDTNRPPMTPKKVVSGCVAVQVDIKWHLLVSFGVWWCLMVPVSVSCCLEMWGGCLRSFSKGIWALFMGVCKVSVHLRVYLSVQALYGTANALYWKSFVRQNSTHLTLLKYQNTKTALYKLHKNHWVFALFEIFGSVRKKITCDSLFGSPCICSTVELGGQ